MGDFNYPLTIGNWCWRKLLGKGSFGEVSLWENCKTGEQIAIKKCILIGANVSQEVVDKVTQRWNNEMHMIENRIQNENVIRAIKVNPPKFIEELSKTNISGLPFLTMEYCNGGDLRKEISANCCGLKEPNVLNILKSLKNAVSYLHTMGITHRDIKPENIVIQRKGDIKIYKMINLYARNIEKWKKENDEICSSVKTLRNVILKISERYESILRRSTEVKDYILFEGNGGSISEYKNNNLKFFEVVKIQQLYEKLKTGEQKILKYHKKICDLIRDCLRQREIILSSPRLKYIQDSLSTINKEFIEIQSITTNTFNQLLKYESRMSLSYVKRFNDIWQMIEGKTKEKYEQQDKKKMSTNVIGNVVKNVNVNFEISYFNHEGDTKFLIEENKKLRRIINGVILDIRRPGKD